MGKGFIAFNFDAKNLLLCIRKWNSLTKY